VRARPAAGAAPLPSRGQPAATASPGCRRQALRRAAALCAVASLLASSGCASEDEDATTRNDEQVARKQGIRPLERAHAGDIPSSSAAPVERATCPPRAGNCRSATGVVLYVERVDPDGDGDAHFVLASQQSITAPGISVIDVKRSLRPSPLPGRGDRLSAAGPVYRGSYGQRQIEAIELNVARRR
jgi:hypothetical protein